MYLLTGAASKQCLPMLLGVGSPPCQPASTQGTRKSWLLYQDKFFSECMQAGKAPAIRCNYALQGISEGMEPPPPTVSVLTSLMCVCLSVWTYASNGRSTAALAVSSFALLSLQLLTVKKLKFAQLASSVFGLFYCGMP